MSVSSALKHYYNYQKFKLLLIVGAIGVAILIVAGLIWWFLVGAPAWNSFIDNFVAYFASLGMSTALSLADLQTYFLNHWADFLALAIIILSVFGFVYITVRVRRKQKLLGYAVCGIALFSGVMTLGVGLAVGQSQDNPFNGGSSTGTTLNHKYVLVNFDGYFRDGGFWANSTLEVQQVTVTEQTAVGEQTQLRWTRTWVGDTKIQDTNPTAMVQVYVTVKYSDGTSFSDMLWKSNHGPDSQFDWTLRIDCPSGKEPNQFTLKITMEKYVWYLIYVQHYGQGVAYQRTWSI